MLKVTQVSQVSSDGWSEMAWCLGPGCPSTCLGPKGNETIQSLTSKLCSTPGSSGHITRFLARLRQAQSHQRDPSHTLRAERPPYLSQSNTQLPRTHTPTEACRVRNSHMPFFQSWPSLSTADQAWQAVLIPQTPAPLAGESSFNSPRHDVQPPM